ncbi:MAG: S1 RNA-binding domain-containing protein [Anaerolineae bacterium]|nr:S1 RNA-binding domain-containing protein [Anaerolineae bacterium]
MSIAYGSEREKWMEINGYNLRTLSSFVDMALRRFERNDRQQTIARPVERHDTVSEVASELLSNADWDRAATIFDAGESVKAIVTGWNRGGLLVRWQGLQGFVPVSQLREIPVFEDDSARDEQLARWVGEELELRVIELDQGRNRLVFSERATIWAPEEGDRVLEDIEAGQVRQGYISNLCDFGAFVDLGGVDGLIHISELSWGRVTHPRELLTLGQPVDVHVLSVDKEKRRVGLSLKRLQPNPWTVVEREHYVGQVIPAVITNLVDFGAFAQIQEGLEGLVHISELSEEQIGHPSDVVSVGAQVMVRILRIDSANHRLGLSMRQAGEAQTDQGPSQGDQQAGRAFLY